MRDWKSIFILPAFRRKDRHAPRTREQNPLFVASPARDARVRAQTVLLDVFFAAIIFLIVFFFINNAWNTELEQVNQKHDSLTLQLKAFSVAESLVKTRGEPDNWEELDFSQVEEIGLAESSLSLDQDKLNSFKNLDQNYSGVKSLLFIPEFDYFFELEEYPDVNAGIAPPQNASIVSVRRVVEYNGDETIAVFYLYKVE